MNNSEMQKKLKEAQDLLSDVYHVACDEGLSDLERLMSVADGCIIDALESL